MSLQNLLKIGQLKEHPSDRHEIERLLTAAERNLRDARVKEISPETRFVNATSLTTRAMTSTTQPPTLASPRQND